MNRRGRPKHPDILTPREWEVLALVREGLSNDAIAGALGISVNGVKFHVSEILSKLGVSNRREAARWQPEERPSWPAAFAPFLGRKLGLSWLSWAAATGVAAVVTAGAVFLTWALIATGGDSQPSPGRNATHADGVPSTFLIGSDLIPIDPATGQDLAGYDYTPLARGAAISPDGGTAAITNLSVINQRQEQKLSLFDIEQWEKAAELGFFPSIGGIQWSPDGRRLYAHTDGAILTIEAASGTVVSRVDLPSEFYGFMSLGSGGRILYLFEGTTTGDTIDDQPAIGRVVAFDLVTGNVRDELVLPDVHLGVRPAVVVSPDGRRGYVVHADADRVTVVDLEEMQVERSEGFGRSASLFERFLSFLAGSVDAKELPQEKWAAISPDGRYLYVSGASAERAVDTPAGKVLERTSLGLRVIDTNTLDIVAEIEPGGEHVYGALLVHPSGRYLYAYAELLFVLDPATLDTMAVRSLGSSRSRSVVAAPAPPAVEVP